MPGKREIVDALEEIATLLELSGESPFKVRAFSKAARVLRDLDREITELARPGVIERIPGIGNAIGAVIREVLTTGESEKLTALRAIVPDGLRSVAAIHGIDGRNAAILHRELGIASLDDLEKALAAGRIRETSGLGSRMEARIAEALRVRHASAGRVLLHRAIRTASGLAQRLGALEGIERVEPSGQVRRRCEIVETILIVAACRTDPVDAARRARVAGLDLTIVRDDGARLVGRTGEGTTIEMFFVDASRFAITLFVTTGSDAFVGAAAERAAAKGLAMTADGLRRRNRSIPLGDENEVFGALGIPAVPAELREDASAIDLADERLDLVETADLRGTFHVHTTWSDGRATLREMLEAARSLGLGYAGISDHSRSAVYAHGLDEGRLALQRAEIERLRPEVAPLRVFWGTECDILADGTLDYDSATLAQFDFVIASIHSQFKMPRAEMTARIVRAIRNPFTTFIGHLTGRMLLGREGCHVDYEPIFAAAAEHGVGIEINGSPRRLDLDWRRMQEAVGRGVLLSIHPDAHDVSEYGNLMTGTWAARKGGLRRQDVLNTRGVDDVVAWLAERRAMTPGSR